MERILLIQEEPRNCSELVEVPVNVAGIYRINFPDNQQLRSMTTQDVRIQGIRLITPDVSSFGPITGAQNAPVTELQKCFLVLYCEGWEKAHYIPLLVLNDTSAPNGTAAHKYTATKFGSWKNVDWGKSYILYSGGSGGSDIGGGAYEFMFDVEYTKFDATGAEIVGPS
jgi:hypothetical protein